MQWLAQIFNIQELDCVRKESHGEEIVSCKKGVGEQKKTQDENSLLKNTPNSDLTSGTNAFTVSIVSQGAAFLG